MKPFKYTRRAFNVGTVAIVAIAAVGGGAAALADQRVVKIGITLPFTGADAEDATLIKNGVMIAFDEANAAGGVAGYKIVPVIYDDGTATAGQYAAGPGLPYARTKSQPRRWGSTVPNSSCSPLPSVRASPV